MTVDLLGVVTKVDSLGSIKRKSDGSELSRRDLTILDQRWAWAKSVCLRTGGNACT